MSDDGKLALEEALKQNAKLKKRLAKLQRIESGLDAKDDKEVRKRERQTQREVCHKAFEEFDVDKSGFIDLHELSLLATELNAPMNAQQLEEALKAIDLSGDGKISFDEFYKWWNSGAAPPAGDKSPITLALLHARLVSHKGKKIMEQMAAEAKKSGVAPGKPATATAAAGTGTAAASASTASATAGKDAKDAKSSDAKSAAPVNPLDVAVPKGSRVNDYILSFNDFESGAAKGKLTLAVATGLANDPAIQSADPKYGAFASLDIRSTGKADFIPYLQAVAKTFSRSLAEYATFSVSQPSADTARITVGAAVPFPDPMELLTSLGINVDSLAHVYTSRVEFAHSLADFFDPKQALTPLDALTLRSDTRVVLDASVVAAMTNAAKFAPTGAGGIPAKLKQLEAFLPYFNSADSKTSFRFAAIRPLLEEALGDGTGAAAKLPKVLTESARKPVTALIADALAKGNERSGGRAAKDGRAAVATMRLIALTLNRDFAEITGLTVCTRSGLGVRLGLDGLLSIPHLLTAVSFFEEAIANLPAVNPQAGGGRPQVGRRVLH